MSRVGSGPVSGLGAIQGRRPPGDAPEAADVSEGQDPTRPPAHGPASHRAGPRAVDAPAPIPTPARGQTAMAGGRWAVGGGRWCGGAAVVRRCAARDRGRRRRAAPKVPEPGGRC